MILSELKNILSELKIPVSYNHFTKRTEPPFITYSVTQTMNRFADNIVVQKFQMINVELYTTKKDIKIEEKLEKLLNDNELPYEIEGETYIESENVYQIIYQITI